MKLGCTTVTFGGTIERKLDAMAAAGFEATELWPRDLYEHAMGPDFTLEALRKSGLALSVYQALRDYEGMGSTVRAHKLKIASQLMDQMDLIGGDLLVLPSNGDRDATGDRAAIVDDMRRLGDLAAERGKRIAYEVLAWGRWINDYRDGADLVAAVGHPCVGLMVDSFHVFARETPVSALADIPAELIFNVEVADAPATRLPAIEVSRNYRLFPGEGVHDVAGFCAAMRRTGFDGVWTVEIFNAHYRSEPPEAVATRAYRSLSEHLE